VPVYTTAVVEQPWSSYTQSDHGTWATLFERQQQVLQGRASDEFLRNQRAMGMTPDRIPKFDDLNRILRPRPGGN
jgi:phenylalanine-4-hydroxylase